ncbi:transcriptional regulator [Sphingobium yanoikuyae]|uniref:transcriptional regulator n=1 Tax=Sphingobium yanoikuyae TaxID=13690 RepID=UPI0028969654|nr:YdaS family helix-turn-helix protein [Sphingobium yanoikuyae]
MAQVFSPFEALKDAVAKAGGQAATARICGVSQPAVWKWLQSGKRLPAEHVLAMEAETRVSRHLLRPDIYPRFLEPAGITETEVCGDAVQSIPGSVACDRKAVLQRKDIA